MHLPDSIIYAKGMFDAFVKTPKHVVKKGKLVSICNIPYGEHEPAFDEIIRGLVAFIHNYCRFRVTEIEGIWIMKKISVEFRINLPEN